MFLVLSVLVSISQSAVAASDFPPCYVCGQSGLVTNRSTIISIPKFINETTCAVLERDGWSGKLNPATCTSARNIVTQICGCSEAYSNFPVCNVCGIGQKIGSTTASLTIPGFTSPLDCSDVAQLGIDRYIDPNNCPTVKTRVQASCGCIDIPGNNAVCDVCGTNKNVMNLTNVLNFPGYEPLRCSQWQDAGFKGLLNSKSCPYLAPLTTKSCGCGSLSAKPTPKPTRTPTRNPTRTPTRNPTLVKTTQPTPKPSSKPSPKPSPKPIPQPTPKPSIPASSPRPTPRSKKTKPSGKGARL